MKAIALLGVAATGLLGGCAATPEQIECFQPNRRVMVEMAGTKPKPVPAPKPGAPAPKPGAKVAAPKPVASGLNALLQGNSAFDFKSAAIKADGKAELDKLVNSVASGVGKDMRALTVGSVIISGHSDRLEAYEGDNSLSESRAKGVMEYLVSKGINPKLIFWEGVGSRQPVPVTKFCE
ncbi:MAG: OmpA family protein [Betaproteobacteria bacterium]|nr:OmpA family protein [Betaproteobacteria bacterium]